MSIEQIVKRNVVKAYGTAEAQLHMFFTSALMGGE
jgi:hypothetical protein